MVIYPILFLIFNCAVWVYSLFTVGRDSYINFFATWGHTLIAVPLLYLCGFFHVIHWPQITWICLTTIGCVTALVAHGTKYKTTLGGFFFVIALSLTIYIYGGAFQYLK